MSSKRIHDRFSSDCPRWNGEQRDASCWRFRTRSRALLSLVWLLIEQIEPNTSAHKTQICVLSFRRLLAGDPLANFLCSLLHPSIMLL